MIKLILTRLLNNLDFGYSNLIELNEDDKNYIISKLSNLTGNVSKTELTELVFQSLGFLENEIEFGKVTGDLKRDLNHCIDLACLTTKFEL